jgi:quercetin dioxygenase-like cupin family protein
MSSEAAEENVIEYVKNPEALEQWDLYEGIAGKVAVNGRNMTAMMATWQPRTRFAVHLHPHEQIGICLQGEAIFTIDGKEYEVRKGDVYHIPPNVPHAERNDGDVPAVFFECFSPVREDLLRKRFEAKILE